MVLAWTFFSSISWERQFPLGTHLPKRTKCDAIASAAHSKQTYIWSVRMLLDECQVNSGRNLLCPQCRACRRPLRRQNCAPKRHRHATLTRHTVHLLILLEGWVREKNAPLSCAIEVDILDGRHYALDSVFLAQLPGAGWRQPLLRCLAWKQTPHQH